MLLYILVECRVFQPPDPSVSINSSHIIEAYVGEDLSIGCTVASLPSPSSYLIRWYSNNYQVPYAIPPVMHIDYIEGPFNVDHCQIITTLTIRNLTYEDSGNYSCVASATDHHPVSDTVILKVTKHKKQPTDNNKLLIIQTSIPASVVIILSSISVTLGYFYYQHARQVKLRKALEEYQKRPLPRKGSSS